MEITLQKKMSSSLSKATSDNLKIIRSVHTHKVCLCVLFFRVVFSGCCFAKVFSVIRFVFINFTLVFPFSCRSSCVFVVVVVQSSSHSLAHPLTHSCTCSSFFFITLSQLFFPFVLMYFLQCM